MLAPSPVTGLRRLQPLKAATRISPALSPPPAGARKSDAEGALIEILEEAAKAIVRRRKLPALSYSDTRLERALATVDLGEFISGDCAVGAERIDVDVGAARGQIANFFRPIDTEC